MLLLACAATQLYHGHYLIISPLHGHGEVANENPFILPRTLSIVGALILLKRRAEKKMRAPLLGLPKSLYYSNYTKTGGIEKFERIATALKTVLFYSCKSKNSCTLVSVMEKVQHRIFEVRYSV